MRIKTKKNDEILEELLKTFEPRNIEEDFYEECIKFAGGNFITTSKYVVYLYKTERKSNTKYTALPISTVVEIISSQQDILTKERNYFVRLFDGKEYITLTFDSSILTSAGAKQLLQYGCVFDENNLKFLLRYLSLSACKAPVNYVHSGLGWNLDNEPLFLSSKAISNTDFQSEYVGKMSLKPCGSLDVWLNMIKKEVLGKPALEFALILGFASPILGYLNNFTDLGCFIFNFGNNSSKGKTTTAMLIASTFSNPAFDKGLVTTFNSTDNAIIKFVSQADGHPVVLDEVATGSRTAFRKLLYQICSGTEKKRLNQDSSQKNVRKFGSIVITTAEFPIIDETATDGIKARVFELNFDLTKNAEQADSIKKTVYSNYGQAGRDFAEFLVKSKLDSLYEEYEKTQNILMGIYNKSNLGVCSLTARILSKLTVILLTAKYVKECFDLDINLEGITKTIVKLEQSITNETPIEDKALDCIIQYASMNKSKFITGNEEYNLSIEGKILNSGTDKKIIVLKTIVEQILSDNGFENAKMIYKKWGDKKILIKDKDRPYKRLRLSEQLPVQPCFIFKVS